MESNISRDHIALEAMKIIYEKSICHRITPLNRIKAWLGMKHAITTTFRHNVNEIARVAYKIADSMIAARENKPEDNNNEKEEERP